MELIGQEDFNGTISDGLVTQAVSVLLFMTQDPTVSKTSGGMIGPDCGNGLIRWHGSFRVIDADPSPLGFRSGGKYTLTRPACNVDMGTSGIVIVDDFTQCARTGAIVGNFRGTGPWKLFMT